MPKKKAKTLTFAARYKKRVNNYFLKQMKLDKKYEKITSGDKIQYYYVQEPNKYALTVMAFKNRLPEEYKETFPMDKERQFEKKMNATYPEWDEGYDRVFQPCNTTATIYLYCFELIKDKYLTLDYEVILVGGKVVSSHLKEYEIETDQQQKEREERDKACQEKYAAFYEATKAFRSRWYYPVIREVYNPFIFFLSKGLLALSQICNKLSYSLRRF